jgi:hypothetical protein
MIDQQVNIVLRGPLAKRFPLIHEHMKKKGMSVTDFLSRALEEYYNTNAAEIAKDHPEILGRDDEGREKPVATLDGSEA